MSDIDELSPEEEQAWALANKIAEFVSTESDSPNTIYGGLLYSTISFCMKMEIDQRQFLEEITSTWLTLEAAEKATQNSS